MEAAVAKWAVALNTFDAIKHKFQDPGQVEKALNTIFVPERVLLFRGSESEIIERLSAYDKEQGPTDLETLLRRSRTRYYRVCDRVVRHTLEYFAPQIHFADDERLSQLYAMAQASPMTSDKAVMKATANIVFDVAFGNGFSAGFSSRAMLVPGFQNGLHPVICKFTLDSEDVCHEHHILAQLASVPAVTGIVSPVQSLALKPGKPVLVNKTETVFGAKYCLVMPLYPSNLQHLPVPMDERVVLACGRSLETTLKQMHGKGYAHNDIKAANVYISADGGCVLGDFGAASELGQPPRECTSTHWPDLLDNKSLSTEEGSAAVDFFQLAVTLLERTGAFVLQRGPTPDMCREGASVLKNADLQSFVKGLLQHQV